MIAGEIPAPAPGRGKPPATEGPPAVALARENAEPPQPGAAAQPAAEPPFAAAPPTLGERAAHALAAIEPTASAKPPGEAVAKVEAEPAPIPRKPSTGTAARRAPAATRRRRGWRGSWGNSRSRGSPAPPASGP